MKELAYELKLVSVSTGVNMNEISEHVARIHAYNDSLQGVGKCTLEDVPLKLALAARKFYREREASGDKGDGFRLASCKVDKSSHTVLLVFSHRFDGQEVRRVELEYTRVPPREGKATKTSHAVRRLS